MKQLYINFLKNLNRSQTKFSFIWILVFIVWLMPLHQTSATSIDSNIDITTADLGGGAEIELTIIDEGCLGTTGILSIEVTGNVTYLWSTGETTASIMITENGTYSVVVTFVDIGEIQTSTIVVDQLEPGVPFAGYTILAIEEVKLEKYNTVLSGAVGATDEDGKIELKNNTNVYSFVQANEVNIDDTSYADHVILSQADMVVPDFVYNNFSEDAEDLKVEENQTLRITDILFKKVEVKKNATLIVDGGALWAKELKIEDGATVVFKKCTNVVLNKELKIEKNVMFNPTAQDVTVYADYKVSVKEGSTVIANINANDNDIKVEGKEDNPTTMRGFFAGKKVEGKYYVSWEAGNLCNPCDLIIPEGPVGECDCSGGMTQLTIAYSGGAGANLTVNSGNITDNGDGTYTVNVAPGDDKLEKDFEISDGQNTGEIHTSCSRDVLGETFAGVFMLIGHIDRDGHVCTTDSDRPVPLEGMEVLLYPNPTKGSFNILVNTTEVFKNINITVFTITSEKLFSLNTSSNEIILNIGEHLESGFYLVRVEMDDHVKVLKLIKQ